VRTFPSFAIRDSLAADIPISFAASVNGTHCSDCVIIMVPTTFFHRGVLFPLNTLYTMKEKKASEVYVKLV
jgi:hypothetical protein